MKEIHMKLYYSAGACSTSCHIILEESGLKYEAIEIDWDNKTDPNIPIVTQLNPLGTLPIFITKEGKQLDQNLAILTYIADQVPNMNLLPVHGSIERAEAFNWLSFVCSDLQKSIGALFSVSAISADPVVQATVKKYMTSKATGYLQYLDSKLAGKDYLMGKTFTIADAYAFVVVGWTKWLEIPLTPYSNLDNYIMRIGKRPAVAKVIKDEEL
jgi:glutathione S-transferase